MEAVGLDGGGWMGWRVGGRRWMEGPGGGWRDGLGARAWMEGAGRGGPNRTNRTAQTKLQEEPNRNQSKTHPRNRNEPKRTAALL